MSLEMNGARSLLQTLLNCGVEVCFANPGTSEMHFVAALDSVSGMRPVLCLFEGVVTGAADGYGRVAGKPAVTLLHLGPGLANGLANLHNARRAATPIVNVVGDHATYHLQYDALLTSDIVGFARPVSSWICESKSATTVAGDAARAVQAARAAPGGIATLILPADTAWNAADHAAGPLPDIGPAAGRQRRHRGGRSPAGQRQEDGAAAAWHRVARRRTRGGGSRPGEDRRAAAVRHVRAARRARRGPRPGRAHSVLRRADRRVPGRPRADHPGGQQAAGVVLRLPGQAELVRARACEFSHLSLPHEDGAAALQSLADALGAPSQSPIRIPLLLPELPSGALNAASAAQIIAHLTPDNAIFAEEAATSGLPLLMHLARARPHTHLPLTGGSIGQGLPLAVGAAIAAPDRKVICPHGDGGAAYTVQALWTMAREKLDVTTVIYANRSYAILNIELQRVGASGAGAKAMSMLDLHDPEMNWAEIARGFGIEASRATTCEEFAAQYASAMQQRGPRLIEALI